MDPESCTVPAPFTEQVTLGVGMPLIINVTLKVPPVSTFTVDWDAAIWGAACKIRAPISTVTVAVAEPTALLAVQLNVDVPPLGTVLGAV